MSTYIQQYARSFTVTTLILLFTLLNPSAIAQETQTLGNLDVDRMGAAVYTLPISAINGTGNAKPNIAALYNSQAANGILGKGTSISGLSVIKRCQQTLVRDGQNKALTWTNEDRFCIDTQRLMLVTGTQGATDSQYRTEIDNGVLYTAKGGTSGNPDYFEAKAADGATLTFGGSSDAKELGGATMTWALNQYQDIAQNTIQYVYEGTAADGLRIKKINYAFALPNTTLNPGAYIEFIYKDRDDPISKYVAGYEFRTNKLLTQINTYGMAGLLYRSYQFDTATSSGLAGYVSRWQSVKECTTFTNCFDTTQFEWGRTQKNITTNVTETKNITMDFLGEISRRLSSGNRKTAQFPSTNYNCPWCVAQAIDFNGNGIADFFWIELYTNGKYGYVSSNDGATLPSDAPKYPWPLLTPSYDYGTEMPPLEFADINADGFPDVITPLQGKDYSDPYHAWGVTFTARQLSIWLLNDYRQFGFHHIVKPLDLNGDGFQEILGINQRSIDFTLYKTKKNTDALPSSFDYRSLDYQTTSLRLSDIPTADGIFVEYKGDMTATGDFNNDGKKDLIILVKLGYPTDNKQIYKINWYEQQGAQLIFKETIYQESKTPMETYTDYNGNYKLLEFVTLSKLKIVDINGDGLDDVAFNKNGVWMYAINKGNGFLPFVTIPNKMGVNFPSIGGTFIDVNNDGKADYIYGESAYSSTTGVYTNPSVYVRYWNSKLAAFDDPVLIRTTSDFPILFADMNGDGFVDIVENHRDERDGSKETIKVYGYTNNIGNSTAGFQGVLDQDTIITVKTGLNSNASLDYQTLIKPKQLDILTCASGNMGITPCYDFSANSQYKPLKIDIPHKANSLDTADGLSPSSGFSYYYSKINEPFLGLNNPYVGDARVSQYVAPLPIVIRAKATQNNITSDKKYYYNILRTQAGGRGLLGFEKTSVQDVATGAHTDTLWRLDWPYTGTPSTIYSFNSSSEILKDQAFIYKADTVVDKQFKLTNKSFESFYTAGATTKTDIYTNGTLTDSQNFSSSSSISSSASSVSSVVTYPMLSLMSPLPLETYKLEDGNEYVIIAKTYSANGVLYKNTDGTNPKILYFINGVLQTGLRSDPIEPIKYWKPSMAGDYVVETQTTLEDGTLLKSRSGTFRITQVGAPSVSINKPLANSTVKEGDPILISADTSGSAAPVQFISFYANGNLIGITDINSPSRITWVPNTTGEINISAVATDSLGKKTTTASRRVFVTPVTSSVSSQSSSAPAVPYVELSAPLPYLPENIGLGAETPLFAYVLNPDGTKWLDNDYHEAKIDFYANGNLILNARKDPKGPMLWWTPTETGSYGIKAVANLGGGKRIESKIGAIIVKAVGMPTVTLTAPQKNGFIKLGDSLSLTASASDPDGNLSWVRFYANDEQINSYQFNNGPYSLTWKPTALGDYVIRAVAMDSTYIKATSSSVIISVVDPGSKPAVTLVYPDDATSFAFGSLLNMYANAVDFDGSLAKVEFYANDQLVGTSTSAPYKTSFTPKKAGVYVLKAVAYDNLNNVTSSAVHTIQYGLVAPKLSLLDIENDDDCFLGVSFNASKNTPANLLYELYVRPVGQDWPSVPVAQRSVGLGDIPPFKKYFPSHASGDFEYRSRVCPVGQLEACSVYSEAVPVHIGVDCKDIALPVVSLINPPNKVKLGDTVTLTAQISVTDKLFNTVHFYYGEQEIGVRTAAPYTLSWTPTATGHDYLYAQADTGSGGTGISDMQVLDILTPADFANGGTASAATSSNTGTNISSTQNISAQTSSAITSASTTSAGSTPTIDTSKAQISLLSPAPNAVTKVFVGSQTPLLATVYDQELGTWKNADGKTPRIEFYINNQLATGLQQDGAGALRYWRPTVNNTYSIKAVAYLDGGKTLTSSLGTIQVVPPEPPKITLRMPAGTQPFSVGTVLSLQADIVDPDHQLTELRFFANGSPISATGFVEPYNATWIPTAAGNYQLEAQAIDNLGQVIHSPSIQVQTSDVIRTDYNGIISLSNFGDASFKGLKWTPIHNADMLVPLQPSIQGVSYNNISSFLVKEPLRIINRADIFGSGNLQAAKLIVIDAAQIQINSSIELIGEPADLLLISSSTNTITCGACSFKNFGRVTLAAAKSDVGAYLLNVGNLKATAGGKVTVENLDASGIVSLEILAEHVATKGEINTQLFTTGASSLVIAPQKISGQSQIVGSGGVSILDGTLSVNYETLNVNDAGKGTGINQDLAANISSGSVNITSTADVALTGIISTHSDVLAAQIYRSKLAPQPESIVIKTLVKANDPINSGNINVLGSITSDNQINLISSGKVTFFNTAAIFARNTYIVSKLDFANQGTVYASRVIVDKKLAESAPEIHIEASAIDNRGSIYAEDLQKTTGVNTVQLSRAGKVVLATENDISNHFGGSLRAEKITVSSTKGYIRNGSLFAFDDPVRETQHFTAEPHNTTKLSTLSDLPLAQGKPKASKAGAEILAKDIEIYAGAAVENINPYTEPVQSNLVSGILTATASSKALAAVDSVKIEALHKLDIKAPLYVLNTSASMGVSTSQDDALFHVETPVIRNERYYIYTTAELVNENNQTQTGNVSTSTTFKGIQTRMAFYSPPGLIFSFAPAEFNFGDSLQDSKGLLNNASFVDLYSEAKFSGTTTAKITSIGIQFERQAYEQTSSQVTTLNECMNVPYATYQGYNPRQICKQNNYSSSITPEGKTVSLQLENTLFGVAGHLFAKQDTVTGRNNNILSGIKSKAITDYTNLQLSTDWQTVLGSRVTQGWIPSPSVSLSQDGLQINTVINYSPRPGQTGSRASESGATKSVKDLLTENIPFIQANVNQMINNYQAWWGIAQ